MRKNWTVLVAVLVAVGCGGEVGEADVEGEPGLISAAAPLEAGTVVEGEGLSLPSGSGQVVSDAAASGGRALNIWANATATGQVTTGAVTQLVLRARGDQCEGAPQAVVRVNGTQRGTVSVTSSGWADYPVSASLAAGAQRVEVAFINDRLTSTCDRNLYVDSIRLGSSAPPPAPPPAEPPPSTNPPPSASGNPFAGAKFFVDPSSNARRQADAWRSSRPADAQQMEKIAQGSHATWLGEWSGDVQATVRSRVDQVVAAGALPVFVAYNIPARDCGSYSAGGVGSPAAYRTWIRNLKAGIGNRRAVVILEPDALAGADCLSAADRQTRFELLKDAVSVLSQGDTVAVYIDAGHSKWLSASEAAARLRSAGIEQARGFSLNVSNYNTTAEEVAYGKSLSGLVGGKTFVVDTSRNGRGSNGQWCNPSGRALGPRPTASTGEAAVDAYLWVKAPGESDGTCNGGPSAGTWWPEYALGLAQRAAY